MRSERHHIGWFKPLYLLEFGPCRRPACFVQEWTPVKIGGHLPQYPSDRRPAVQRDLREAIFSMRRPELYRIIFHP
ncbi:MAG TPA: hypothetical protein EYP85_05945 [Armatimonadetes bacterium]|nr:hypothetical protein [Armatimonadota bacterium]